MTALYAICMMAMISLIACGANNRKAEAERLLKEKYNETFEVSDYSGKAISADYYTVTAHAKDHPDLPFHAHINADGSSMADGYVCRRVCRRLSKELLLYLNDLHGNYYIEVVSSNEVSKSDDPNCTPTEFMEVEPQNNFTIMIFKIDGSDSSKDIYSSVVTMLADNPNIKGKIEFFEIPKNEYDKAKEYLDTHPDVETDFTEMTDPYYKGYSKYKNGTMEMSGNKFVEMMTKQSDET